MYRLIIILLATFFVLFSPKNIHAQEVQPYNEFERGKVTRIIDSGAREVLDLIQPYQIVEIEVVTGGDKGRKLEVEHGARTTIREYELVKVGEEVVLSALGSGENKEYFIVDKYRLPAILFILAGFFALVIGFSRFRGLASIIGMLISLLILIKFIVPSIASGADPVIISLLGASAIVFVSIYLAHGFNTRTTIAVVSTIIALGIAVGLSFLFVFVAHLSGAGSEDAYALQYGQFANVNLRGLLLAGIIIGTLGVLDDITTSLSASVDEIKKANSKLTAKELYSRGISVGREHISSLVNTLVLAYAGASMPVFLFFLAIKDTQPLWVILNNQLIAEEIIRTLVGSTALVLAVPITTFIAAAVYSRNASTK